MPAPGKPQRWGINTSSTALHHEWLHWHCCMNKPGLTRCPFKYWSHWESKATGTLQSGVYTHLPKLQGLLKRQGQFTGSLVLCLSRRLCASDRLCTWLHWESSSSRVVTTARVFHSTRWNCAQPFQEQDRHWQSHTDCAKGQRLPPYKSISNLGVMQLLRMHVLVSERYRECLEIEKCIWTKPDVPSDLFSCWNTPMFESLTEQSIPIPHKKVKQKQQNDFKQMTFLIHRESFLFQVTGSQL